MPTSTDGRANGMRPTRIMIIDDHEISRAAYCALLRTEGLNLTTDLSTSSDVLAAARALHPDVAIIDVTPATDTGFAIARQLRQLAVPPVVILTSSADRAEFGAQVNGYWFVAKADISATTIASCAGIRDSDGASATQGI